MCNTGQQSPPVVGGAYYYDYYCCYYYYYYGKYGSPYRPTHLSTCHPVLQRSATSHRSRWTRSAPCAKRQTQCRKSGSSHAARWVPGWEAGCPAGRHIGAGSVGALGRSRCSSTGLLKLRAHIQLDFQNLHIYEKCRELYTASHGYMVQVQGDIFPSNATTTTSTTTSITTASNEN